MMRGGRGSGVLVVAADRTGSLGAWLLATAVTPAASIPPTGVGARDVGGGGGGGGTPCRPLCSDAGGRRTLGSSRGTSRARLRTYRALGGGCDMGGGAGCSLTTTDDRSGRSLGVPTLVWWEGTGSGRDDGNNNGGGGHHRLWGWCLSGRRDGAAARQGDAGVDTSAEDGDGAYEGHTRTTETTEDKTRSDRENNKTEDRGKGRGYLDNGGQQAGTPHRSRGEELVLVGDRGKILFRYRYFQEGTEGSPFWCSVDLEDLAFGDEIEVRVRVSIVTNGGHEHVDKPHLWVEVTEDFCESILKFPEEGLVLGRSVVLGRNSIATDGGHEHFDEPHLRVEVSDDFCKSISKFPKQGLIPGSGIVLDGSMILCGSMVFGGSLVLGDRIFLDGSMILGIDANDFRTSKTLNQIIRE